MQKRGLASPVAGCTGLLCARIPFLEVFNMCETERTKEQKENPAHGSAFRWRLPLAFASAALALGCAAGCGSGHSPAPAVTPIQSSAAIWFHPKPAGGTEGGSTDFLLLFQANAPWPRAMAKTQVIGLYAGWIADASDQDLQSVVEFLNAHNMGIEIEAPAMQALATCGSGVEGYVPYGQSVETFTLAYLQRLQSLGAQVPYIKVDEPYFFGNNVLSDPNSCLFSVEQVATEVGQYVQIVKTVYPNAQVGDVEPIIASAYLPDVATAMAQWHATYQTVTGAPFPFFIADTDFSNPAWPTIVKGIETATKQSGMQFGIIYIGDMQDVSDSEWTGTALSRFQTYQGQNGGQPDYVLFQSWEPEPQYCLPETDPTTFTGLLDAYIEATS
ncbi:MAG: hypothetical protein ABSB39_01105 [Candidatus Sulfotelmatobacter sp.]|jgi:hypothetical protein